MFSKACEYGIRATLHIAEQSEKGNRTTIRDIAIAIDSPEAFTAKILQKLARHNIVHSIKGPYGGFFIAEDRIKEIKLKDLVYAIDGPSIYQGCALGLPQCNDEKPCPMHHKYASLREELNKMLEETSIQELAKGLKEGQTFLKH